MCTKTDTQIKRQKRELRNKPIYIQIIYNRGAKNIQWRKNSLFNTINGAGKTGQPYAKQ